MDFKRVLRPPGRQRVHSTFSTAQLLLLVAIASLAFHGGLARGAGPVSHPPPRGAVLVLDTSESMAKGTPSRAEVMKEAAKLFVSLLPNGFELTVIDFNSTARTKAFTLKSTADRRAAHDHIDGLSPDGGTDYLAALDAVRVPRGMPILFLSDGAPQNPPAEVLARLKAGKIGPLHTLGVGLSGEPAARTILAQMAASGGGSAVTAEDGEGVVKAFLDVARQVGQLRSFAPDRPRVELADVCGRVVAIGFDATPRLSSPSGLVVPTVAQTARLPGEHASVAVAQFDARTRLTIEADQKRSPAGRLAVIYRDDLARDDTVLAGVVGGAAPSGGVVRAVTRFTDRDGKPIDPRKRPDLTTDVRVLDEKGAVVGTTRATPHPIEPAVVATVRLPAAGTTATVVNDTSDGGFRASRSRTVTLVKPLALIVTPDAVTASVRMGTFTTRLQVKTAEPVAKPTTYLAAAENLPLGLALNGADVNADGLTLQWEASRPGTYRCTVLITANGGGLYEAVSVPVEVTVAPLLQGLEEPAKRTERLKAVIAGCGKVELGSLSAGTVDAEAAEYEVEVEDLANGSHAIPLAANAATIRPVAGKPAALVLRADIGDVPAGEYAGVVRLKLGTQVWETIVRVAVGEPIAAKPIDLGEVAPDAVVRTTVAVRNLGGQGLREVAMKAPAFAVRGDSVDVVVPEKVGPIPAGGSVNVAVAVSVGRLVTTRGAVAGTLILKRTGGLSVEVPVTMTLVDPGRGGGTLRVVPAALVLSAAPGEVAKAEVRVKLPPGAAEGPFDLSGVAGLFSLAGKPAEVDSTVRAAAAQLTPATPVSVTVLVIAPKTPGTYSGSVTIQAGPTGSATVPITLTVK